MKTLALALFFIMYPLFIVNQTFAQGTIGVNIIDTTDNYSSVDLNHLIVTEDHPTVNSWDMVVLNIQRLPQNESSESGVIFESHNSSIEISDVLVRIGTIGHENRFPGIGSTTVFPFQDGIDLEISEFQSIPEPTIMAILVVLSAISLMTLFFKRHVSLSFAKR